MQRFPGGVEAVEVMLPFLEHTEFSAGRIADPSHHNLRCQLQAVESIRQEVNAVKTQWMRLILL